jgi:hypothetical protein
VIRPLRSRNLDFTFAAPYQPGAITQHASDLAIPPARHGTIMDGRSSGRIVRRL